MARIIENSGTSFKEAIIIQDAADHDDGVLAEYRYLERKFGVRGKDWDLVIQSLMQTDDNTHYDSVLIEFPDKTRKKIIFTIESFFDMG